MHLINQIENFRKIDEDDKIRNFLKALRPDTRINVDISKPKTLLEAIEIATICESIYENNNNDYNDESDGNMTENSNEESTNDYDEFKTESRSSVSSSKNAQEVNKYRNNSFTNLKGKSSKDYSSYKCYACNNFGHIAVNCPTRINSLNLSRNSNANKTDESDYEEEDEEERDNKNYVSRNNTGTSRGITLNRNQYNSGRTNNRVSGQLNSIFKTSLNVLYCRELGDTLVTVPGVICGTRVKACLDSGASRCAMSKTLAFKNNLVIDDDKSKFFNSH